MESGFDINESLAEALLKYAAITYKTLSLDDLSEAIKKVKLIKKNEYASDEIKNKSEAIEIVAYIKYLFIRYKNTNFDPVYKKDIDENVNKLLSIARSQDLPTSIMNCQNSLSTTDVINNFVVEAKNVVGYFRDELGEITVYDVEKYNEACEQLDDIIESFSKIEDIEIFNSKKITFFNLKEEVLTVLNNYKSLLIDQKNSIILENDNKLFKELLTPINNYIDYNALFCQDSINNTNSQSLIVVSSPFIDEIYLLVYAYAKNKNLVFYVLDLLRLQNKNREYIESMFLSLKNNKKNVLLINFSKLDEVGQDIVIELGLGYIDEEILLVFADEIGDMKAYYKAFDIAKSLGKSTSGINHIYLQMPFYNDLVDLLANKNMLNDKNRDKVKGSIPFLGYVGLNKVYKTYVEGNDWFLSATKISGENYNDVVKRYLQTIPSQEQLLDVQWGQIIDAKNEEIIKRNFDYDTIRNCNQRNINLVLNSKYRKYEKCGLITRYALTHGDDISIWKALDNEEKIIRLKEALSLVYYILEIDFTPDVEIHTVVGDSSSTLGLCVNGGRTIRFKEKGLENLEETIGTLNHEAYHAFQHFAIAHSYRDSWWLDFGVTRGMVREWSENSNEYMGSSENYKAYRRQVFEAFAFGFEFDCITSSNTLWNEIDFE